jgi:hypothetical protein
MALATPGNVEQKVEHNKLGDCDRPIRHELSKSRLLKSEQIRENACPKSLKALLQVLSRFRNLRHAKGSFIKSLDTLVVH